MANDDFTAHDDELTPEAGEHASEDAAANPFYTEVPPTDLVIDNEIVFDEVDVPTASDEVESGAADALSDTDFVSPEDAQGMQDTQDEQGEEAPFGGEGVPVGEGMPVGEDVPAPDHVGADEPLSVGEDAPGESVAVDETSGVDDGTESAPHDYTVTDFGSAGNEVSLTADALPQSEDSGQAFPVEVSEQASAEVMGTPEAEALSEFESTHAHESAEGDAHVLQEGPSEFAVGGVEQGTPVDEGSGDAANAPYDYTVTDFGGAGTSVSLEADALTPDAPAEESAGAFVEEEPPVELIVEDALTAEDTAQDVTPEFTEPEHGTSEAVAPEFVAPGHVEPAHAEPALPVFEYRTPEETPAANTPLTGIGADSGDHVTPVFADEAPGEDPSLVVEYDPDSDPELTRPALLPETGVPSVLASNAQLPPVEEVELTVDEADIVTPDEVIEGEHKPLFPPTEPRHLPEYNGGLRSTAHAAHAPAAPADSADEVPAPVAEPPAVTEPPAVASAIPVTPPPRGDDSTWQEISRRRSLFHPVSEPTTAPAPEAAADETPAPIPSAFSADTPPADLPAAEATEVLPAANVVEVDEADIHTTTIPVASAEEIANYQPGPHSGEIPLDVLSGREKDVDELSTTMMRRDLLAAPPSREADTAASWHQALHDSAAPLPAGDTPQKLDDAIFEGTTVVPVVPSRVGAHVLALLLTLILAPLTWYFLADAGARMTLAEGAPIASGQVSLQALLEIAIGIIGFIVIVALAVRSSLGAWVSGLILTIAGLPWLIAPAAMLSLTQASFDRVSSLGVIGRNLAHHLQVSAYSGRLLVLGIVLWAIGIVSHSVRRRGRAEEALRSEVERVNPVGAHLTWSARRRAAKEASRNERSNS